MVASEVRKQFVGLTGKEAKKLGRNVTMRSDWNDIKYLTMIEICYAKFSQNPRLKQVLLGTGEEELV